MSSDIAVLLVRCTACVFESLVVDDVSAGMILARSFQCCAVSVVIVSSVDIAAGLSSVWLYYFLSVALLLIVVIIVANADFSYFALLVLFLQFSIESPLICVVDYG